MNEVSERIASYRNWAQDIEIDGQHTLDKNDEKQYLHINRTRVRRRLFFDPLLRSGFLRGKRVLDLACSYGYWSMITAAEGQASYVLGVDAHPPSVEQGRWILGRKNLPSVEMRLADSYETLEALKPGSFDVILCLGFFYHIRDPFRLLQLMRRVASQLVIIDTMVHQSDEAMISLRPVRGANLLEGSVLELELFSSPKAIFWLGHEAGYKELGTLGTNLDADRAGIWDYRSGQRMSFALSTNAELGRVYDNYAPFEFLTPSEDFKKYGLYPELHGGRKHLNGNAT